MSVNNPQFSLRIQTYTLFGNKGTVIPDSGFSYGSTGSGGTLTLNVATAVYQRLPNILEVAVEFFNGTGWTEFRDARFLIEKQEVSDRDPIGMYSLTGQPLPLWMMQRARLEGVEPLRVNGVSVVPSLTVTGVSDGDETITKANHGFVFGDRVRVDDKGKASKISEGSILWVRAVTSNTFKLGVSRDGSTRKNVGTTDGGAATIRLKLYRDTVNYPILSTGSFNDNEKVGVQAIDGSGLSEGSTYYIARNTPSSFGFSSSPGGVALELDTDTFTVFRDLDGQRLFKTPRNSPGYIMGLPFSEAQTRGALKGITRDWTGGSDSNGIGWLNYVTDDSGLPVGFAPGATSLDQLTYLLDQGVVEFYTIGRLFRMLNPGSGSDRATGSPTDFVVGGSATTAPITIDLSNLFNAITLRGEGPIQEQVDGATSGIFGRLEKQFTVSGVTTINLARRLGAQALTQGADPLKQYQITEDIGAALWLPGQDYNRGDYAFVVLQGAKTRLRIAEILYNKDDKGKTTATTVFGTTIAALTARIIKRLSSTTGGIGSAGTLGILATDDTRRAAAPVITATSRGTWNAGGLATSQIDVSWAPVTVDENGLDIGAASYDVWVRMEGQANGYSYTTTSSESATLSPFVVGIVVGVSVRALSTTGTFGVFSNEVEVTTLGPPDIPNPPTPPTLVTKLGGVLVSWDGLVVDPDLGNVPPELGFGHVQVERANTELGTYETVGGGLFSAVTVGDAPLDVGATYWYRLITINAVGTRSLPSTSVSIVVVGIDYDSLGIDVTSVITSANGKNHTTYAPTPATGTTGGDGLPAITGDLWWQFSTAIVIGQWIFSGGAWISSPIGNAVIANIDAAKIVTGILDAARIGANSITTLKLDAGAINGMTITGATIQTGTSGGRMVLNGSGLSAYGSDGVTVNSSISSADGIFHAISAVIKGTIYATAGEIIGDLTMTTGRILMSSAGSIIAGNPAGRLALLRGSDGTVLTQDASGNQAYMSNGRIGATLSGVGSLEIYPGVINYSSSSLQIGFFGAGDLAIGGTGFADAAGNGFVQSQAILHRPLASTVGDVAISSAGNLGVYSSAAKYKTDVRTFETDIDPLAILSMRAITYIDKLEAEEAQAEGRDLDSLERHYGVLADEWDEAGFGHLVAYRDGEVQTFHYRLLALELMRALVAVVERVDAIDGRGGVPTR